MSEKLVERLRGIAEHEDALAALCDVSAGPATRASAKDHHANALTIRRAADRIEALEAENERLRIGISITDLRLTRIGDAAHVEVRIGGIWFRAITEQVDDSFDHIVSASCIRDIVRKAFPETVRAMGAALSPSDKGE